MSSELLTVLGSDGAVRKKDRPALADQDLLLLYRTMVRNRALDDRGMLLQRQGRIGFYLPSRGEEAAGVGSAYAIETEDWVAPSYRQPGVLLLRGMPPSAMFDNCFGNSGDLAKGRQMPVHYTYREGNTVSISSPIGTQIVQATGIGMAMRIRRDGRVCMTYFGDGATSSNDFHSGLNFAAVYKAPVVFVCINNQWAISLPLERQTGSESIAVKAEAYGMPGMRVDGNDVLAVYEASRQAVERARAGEGPTLLELVSFRMGPHSSSDDPTRYRQKALVDEWERKDPIARFEAFLTKEGLLRKEDIERIRTEAETEMSEAARAAAARELPSVASLFEDVWAELPPALREQQARLVAEGETAAADPDAAFPL